MSESKIELHQRKIRNGIRREKERQQKKMWDKLTSAPSNPRSLTIKTQVVTAKTRKLKAGWSYSSDGLLSYDLESGPWLKQE